MDIKSDLDMSNHASLKEESACEPTTTSWRIRSCLAELVSSSKCSSFVKATRQYLAKQVKTLFDCLGVEYI